MFYINVLFILSVLILLVLTTFNITASKTFLLLSLAQLLIIIFLLINNYYQWQLIPLYIVYLLCLLLVFSNKRLFYSRFLLVGKLLILASCWVVSVLSIYLYFIFPIPILSKPTGIYDVGVTSYTLSSPYCTDPISGSKKYQVYFKVWFPKDNNHSGMLANYPITREYMEKQVIFDHRETNDHKLPDFVFLPLNILKSYSYIDTEPNKLLNDLPLIIYNSGTFSSVGQNSILMEELASQGFIVVSIGHIYGSIIIYDDGNTIMPNSRNTMKLFNNAAQEAALLIEERENAIKNGQNAINAQEIYFNRLNNWRRIINDWESDSICVIEFLKNKTNTQGDIFYQKINVNNIGVIGHSLGGFTAGNLCAHQGEVKACVFFDTIIQSDYFFSDMEKPSLFIYAGSHKIIDPYIENNHGSPITVIALKNANHYSFMEQRLLAPTYLYPYQFDLVTTYDTLEVTYEATVKFPLKYMKFDY